MLSGHGLVSTTAGLCEAPLSADRIRTPPMVRKRTCGVIVVDMQQSSRFSPVFESAKTLTSPGHPTRRRYPQAVVVFAGRLRLRVSVRLAGRAVGGGAVPSRCAGRARRCCYPAAQNAQWCLVAKSVSSCGWGWYKREHLLAVAECGPGLGHGGGVPGGGEAHPGRLHAGCECLLVGAERRVEPLPP